ncbi:MAG: DJ/PfpI family protein [Acidimicrobiaceae bacterium]|nr:DJ/PfpI family protein [Acidimicrobiaceae bacterium]
MAATHDTVETSDQREMGSGRPLQPRTFKGQPNDMTTFAGSWDVTIETPIGKMAAVFDISEENGLISGTARSGDEVVEIREAVADGDRLTWVQNVQKPMKLTLKFDVVVDGDSMTGTSKAAIFPASKLYGTRSS